MKVRVSYTVDADDEFRRAVNQYYGRPGLASRDQIRRWYETFGDSMNMDVMRQTDDQ